MRRLDAPSDAPLDAPLPRKRLWRQPVSASTPEPTNASVSTGDTPLLYTSGGSTDSAENIAREFESDPRFGDRATQNWRRDQLREWR